MPKEKMKHFKDGMQNGIPICLGYLAVSFSLGIAARKVGFNAFQGFLISFLNNASAGEYAGIAMIAVNASYIETAIMILITNIRYLLMSCSLSQKFSNDTPFYHRFFVAHFVTDEIFGITFSRAGSLKPTYVYGAALLAASGWAIGTVLGVIAGAVLPVRIVSALSVALYGMFIAIIVPPAKQNKVLGLVILISFALSFLTEYAPFLSGIPSGTKTIILTIVISAAAALIRPIHPDGEENEA